MIHQRGQLLSSCFLLSDLVLTTAAWFLAYYLRFRDRLAPGRKGGAGVLPVLASGAALVVLSAVAYRLAGQYHVGRLRRFREEMVAVFKGSLLLSLLVMATIFFLHDPYESRATILLFWVLSAFLVVVGRRAAWTVIRTLRSRGYNQTFSIIVAAGRAARKMARALQRVNWLGIKNIGFVDEKTQWDVRRPRRPGGFADLPELIHKYGVKHVFVALPLDRTDDARRVFAILSRSLVEVRMVCDVPNLAGLSLTTTNLDGLPLIGLRESPHFGLNIVVKARWMWCCRLSV